MTLQLLKKFVLKSVQENPHLKDDIYEYYQLCIDECDDDCASESHEIELCIESINQLISDVL